MSFKPLQITLASLLLFLLAACTTPADPDTTMSYGDLVDDGDLRIAAYSETLGDLHDPENLKRFTRADILIVQCDQFWGNPLMEGRLELIRAAKPELKIIGYFRSKVAKTFWVDHPDQTYNFSLD